MTRLKYVLRKSFWLLYGWTKAGVKHYDKSEMWQNSGEREKKVSVIRNTFCRYDWAGCECEGGGGIKEDFRFVPGATVGFY